VSSTHVLVPFDRTLIQVMATAGRFAMDLLLPYEPQHFAVAAGAFLRGRLAWAALAVADER